MCDCFCAQKNQTFVYIPAQLFKSAVFHSELHRTHVTVFLADVIFQYHGDIFQIIKTIKAGHVFSILLNLVVCMKYICNFAFPNGDRFTHPHSQTQDKNQQLNEDWDPVQSRHILNLIFK